MSLRDRALRLLLGEIAKRGLLRRVWSPYWSEFPPPPQEHGLPPEAFIVIPARHHIVFRLVGARKPRLRDFESNSAKRRPQAPDETYADYLGISVFGTAELAFENANKWPKRVAVVLLPQPDGFSIARTYPEIEGHYTVWGDSQRLLNNVERVDTRDDPGKFGAEL